MSSFVAEFGDPLVSLTAMAGYQQLLQDLSIYRWQ